MQVLCCHENVTSVYNMIIAKATDKIFAICKILMKIFNIAGVIVIELK